MKRKGLALLSACLMLTGCAQIKEWFGVDEEVETTMEAQTEDETTTEAPTEETTPEETTEEETTTEVVTTTAAPMAKYVVDEAQCLFDIDDILKDVVTSEIGVYDENTLVFIERVTKGDNDIYYANRVDISTGERERIAKLCVDELYEDSVSEYGENAWVSNIRVINNKPLICQVDGYIDGDLYVFDEALSDYVIVDLMPGDGWINGGYNKADGCFYFVTDTDYKLRSLSLDELSFDGDSDEILQVYDSTEVVWESDGNLNYATFNGISDDGSHVNLDLFDIVEDSIFIGEVNVKTGEIDRFVEEDYLINENSDLKAVWHNAEWTQTLMVEPQYYMAETNATLIYSDSTSGQSCKLRLDRTPLEEELTAKYGEYYGAEVIYVFSDNLVDDGSLLINCFDNNTGLLVNSYLWNYSEVLIDEAVRTPEVLEYNYEQEVDYGELTERVHALEKKYGVNIFIGANCKNQFESGYVGTVCETDWLIEEALDEIEEGLMVFPDEMFREIVYNYCPGINLYLVGSLTSDEYGNVSEAAGITTTVDNYLMFAIDIYQYDITETFVHEMIHVIDRKLEGMGVIDDVDKRWEKYNPDSFEYDNSYLYYDTNRHNEEYTSYGEEYLESGDPECVYFVEDYGKTFHTEDRATIFETMIMDGDYDYLTSSHILGKVGEYIACLKENFECFNSENCGLLEERYNYYLEMAGER